MFRKRNTARFKRYTIILSLLFLVGCSSTDTITKYKDREVLVPDIRIESCIKEKIKICPEKINTYRDLVNCYLFNKNEIDKINEKIKSCNQDSL